VPTASRSRAGHVALAVFLGFVWFGGAFFGGYLLGQADALAGRRDLTDLTLRLAQRVGLHPALTPTSAETALAPSDQERFRVFWEAWGLVNQEFYNRSALDGQKMTYGALKGMLETLGDPYTAFTTPREKEAADTSLRGSFDGIGVQVDLREGKVQVVAPIEGSPAERAGLRTGDVITRVDETDLNGLALNEVVALIRGPRGSAVRLTFVRPGQAQPLSVSIERAEIKVDTVRGKLLEGDLGYVRISSFSANSGPDTSAALRQLSEQHPRAFVLDLRSNPGGYLHAAVEVASEFMSDGVVLYQQPASGERQEYRARPGGQATTAPVAVLINKGSASAAEIVAAALHDNGRAVLVGEKSYGKGSVQTVHALSDSSGLRVTSAIWLTPSGRPLEHQGIEPDLPVPSAADGQAGHDAPLEAAVRYLQATAAAPGR
jgi:carboxyl-terminal processing protease